MKRIELVPGIQSSILGFGCAPIMGAVGARQAKRAIDKAIACGINHFDLARSYGYGDAEEFVGRILKDKRNDVVIATKFGIKANKKARLLRPFKPLVRQLTALKKRSAAPPAVKQTQDSGNQIADRFLCRVIINPVEMAKSLNESLKALKTDHVDYFFIHEPDLVIDEIDSILEYAEKLKQEGKIRAFGLAFMQARKDVHAAYLDRFDLLQFNNSPGSAGYDQLRVERKDAPNIFFSPLKGGSKNLSAEQKLRQLNMDFPGSVILCSMFNEQHLQQNTAIFE